MTSIAGFFSKKQYAAMADRELAMKLLKERCLECSTCAMFFNSSLTVSIKALFKYGIYSHNELSFHRASDSHPPPGVPTDTTFPIHYWFCIRFPIRC